MKEYIRAAAYVSKYRELESRGITENFKVGYPYRGQTGEEAWRVWCGLLANEYAEDVVKIYLKARLHETNR